MMSFIREHGQEGVVHKVFDWLQEVDLLSGGRTDERTLALIANMVVNHMKYRSVDSVLMALRDGMSYTDREGKVYGALTWGTVKLWLDRHEERIMEVAVTEHASKVVKGDNYGKEWLDDQEKRSQGVFDRQSREIDRLRKKLENKHNPKE